MQLEYVTPDALQVIERAGRTCYKSEDKITPDSAEKFVRMIMGYEHASVIEHAVASFRIITDRGVTHEIVRHRLASYSQESTRYCNYSKDKFSNAITVVLPVWFYDVDHAKEWNSDSAYAIWYDACISAETSYFMLLNTKLQSPQQARSVLPNSLKTEMVMTANLREWQHFFEMRTPPKAHPQMRALALEGLAQLKAAVPVIFENLPKE